MKTFQTICKAIGLILNVLIIVSCNSNRNPFEAYDKNRIIDTISYASFADSTRIDSAKPTGIHFKGDIRSLSIVDSFLVLSDSRDSFILHIVDLANMKLAGSIIKRGENDNEMLNAVNLIGTNTRNIFWAYDITQGKLLQYELNRKQDLPAIQPTQVIRLKDSVKNAMSPVWISDSVFAAASYVMDDCRFYFFNNNSRIREKTGILPPKVKNWVREGKDNPFKNSAYIYKANLTNRITDKRIAVANCYFPQLEIYNDKNLERIIRGPQLFSPNFDFVDDKLGGQMATENDQTQVAFTWLQSTPSYFYTLFSGKDRFHSTSDKILIFDWLGKPIKIVELKCQVNCFAVQEEKGHLTFYYIHPDSKELQYFSI
jgi:hypothetical protein